MDPKIQMVGIVETEGPDDVVFTPSGILIGLQNNKFTVYSTSADHNRLRGVLSRTNWDELVHGVHWHHTEYRLTDLTEEMTQRGWQTASSIPTILCHLYQLQPRHLFFLQRHVTPLL